MPTKALQGWIPKSHRHLNIPSAFCTTSEGSDSSMLGVLQSSCPGRMRRKQGQCSPLYRRGEKRVMLPSAPMGSYNHPDFLSPLPPLPWGFTSFHYKVQPGMRLPALFSFQQRSVSGNLNVQGQLDVQQLLVVSQQTCHLVLGLLQCSLEVDQLLPGIFEGTVAPLLSITDGRLQSCNLWTLTGKRVDSGDIKRHLHRVAHVPPCFSARKWQTA